MSGFSKASLVIIIVLLLIIALRPIFSPQPALAISHYQYLVVTISAEPHAVQAELDKRVAEGWELATPLDSQIPGVTLIFRKEAR